MNITGHDCNLLQRLVFYAQIHISVESVWDQFQIDPNGSPILAGTESSE
ncbi:unnamed protein product [Acanthoscelides obtectus]|uniref:Uncharacterized protein n=1 Tax=Acanthoscelides obtectus TaxID=200917 RepID=A0A9P0PXH2_ACAOB|nr:unnamed protein product [Acanthoscelides obtectus]CAK1664532.1 hypothetical protein AOBTE_LOCUS24319 [Acanthoscelides obtectus]